VRKVAVQHGSQPGWAFLREMRGEDEESVASTDSEAAIALLDRLLLAQPGSAVAPGHACELAIADRDQLLADAQLAELGGRIDSTVQCGHCGQPFDIDFDLAALIASVRADPPASAVNRDSGGVYRLADGRRFRLPAGEDERAVAALPPADAERVLLQRCLVEGELGDDTSVVSDAMRAVGPLLDVEVGATCAECGYEQSVRFDLQHYLLSAILDQRPQRTREVHQIASAYRWSLAEILSLPRARRKLHVSLIERDGVAR
jgi:hypothetical protein